MSQCLGNLPEGDPRDVAGGLRDRAPDIGRDDARAAFSISSRVTSSGGDSAVELPREAEQRAVACRAHRVDDRGDAPLEARDRSRPALAPATRFERRV